MIDIDLDVLGGRWSLEFRFVYIQVSIYTLQTRRLFGLLTLRTEIFCAISTSILRTMLATSLTLSSLLLSGISLVTALPQQLAPRQQTTEAGSFETWQAPGPGDVRSPCPALNSLANQ